MYEDEATTQRAYHTSVGIVDFDRAATALSHIASGGQAPDQFRVLAALCTNALRQDRVVVTRSAAFDALSAAQLISRMRDELTVDDIDALWSLLFVLFER